MHNRITPTALRNRDGMAVIGRTLHDLRGIRFDEGEGGNVASTDTGTATGAAASEATTADAGAASTTSTTDAAAATAWDGKIESLPADAQKIIADLRKEAGDNRVKAKTESDRVEAILKAAGIKTDEPDPATQLTQSKAESAAAKRELAVFKAAATSGADPSKLLDRASFLTSIAGIDPTDGPAIKAAIDAAVAADNSLKTARAAGASAVETPGGTGEHGQITEAQLAHMTPEQISDAFEKGLLKNLLS